MSKCHIVAAQMKIYGLVRETLELIQLLKSEGSDESADIRRHTRAYTDNNGSDQNVDFKLGDIHVCQHRHFFETFA